MKKLMSILFCILIISCVISPVCAEEEDESIGYLYDEYQLLTDEEYDLIEKKCEEISLKHDFGVYIFIIEDYTEINYDIYDAAVDIYEYFSLGFGEGKDGAILLLSMYDRDYSMVVHGFGETAFGEYARKKAIAEFKFHFSYDDWYEGLESYLNKCDEIIQLARDGTPYVDDGSEARNLGYVISLILAALISLINCISQRSKMRSVFKKGEAMNYIVKDSGNITSRSDTYTHSTTTRTKVSSSSSGSRSRSGGGYSGTSGKF